MSNSCVREGLRRPSLPKLPTLRVRVHCEEVGQDLEALCQSQIAQPLQTCTQFAVCEIAREDATLAT